MCASRRLNRGAPRAAGAWLAGAVLLGNAGAAGSPSVPAAGPAQAPLTIVELQPFRTQATVAMLPVGGATTYATLVSLNPHVNSWFLLHVDFTDGRPRRTFHLQKARPGPALLVTAEQQERLLFDFSDGSPGCLLPLSAASTSPSLDSAQRSGLPFAPLCDGRLYVRNQSIGRASTLEKVTGFLRDRVWGGEEIVSFVKKEFYRDAFREQAAAVAAPRSWTAPESAPPAALVASSQVDVAVLPPHLGLDVDSPDPALLVGRWYALRGLPDVYFSTFMAGAAARSLLDGHERSVNRLAEAESTALVYLVAFDLERFDLRFSLGTDHPRLNWSLRPPSQSRDAALPGPDGIGSPVPLALTGMVPPGEALRTVATFAGGFKREHGAFRFGPLAVRNHGSHYGFVEDGVVFSTLQPGLATVYTTVVGEVGMATWAKSDAARMATVRDARQNGVPLIDRDPRSGVSTPGSFVNAWGEGNWSGSAKEELRTVRAGVCLVEAGTRRFLVYAYFSSAPPSAMVRVFQAYRCGYAMHLDMNALEHTYLALYASQAGRRSVEHLIDDMDVLDRHDGDTLAPRFLGFPDNRDFFYLVRRPAR